MGWPIVLVDSGGIAVTESTNGFGTPVTIADNGFGLAVTVVDAGGMPVIVIPEPAPEGFVYLLGADGSYLTGADGAYLLGAA